MKKGTFATMLKRVPFGLKIDNVLQQRTVFLAATLSLGLSSQVLAQDVSVCGAAPALPTTLQTDESFKGELKGQADFLSKFVGKAELGGQVEAARKQLSQSSDKFLAAQKDAYLAYLFCVIIFQEKNLTAVQRLDALKVFRTPLPSPASRAPGEHPITMAFVESQTLPFDGYNFVQTPMLPAGLPPGAVLPFGGSARVAFQMKDLDQPTEIERVTLNSKRHELSHELDGLKYTADPGKLSGFGSAKPRRFNVRLSKQKIDVSYLKDDGTVSPAKSSDLLATTPFPLLRLDRTAGFQETLDFSILAADPGLYQLEFVAHVISSGSEYELKTPPLYVVRR